MPGRLYRALKLESPTVPEYADDFRLIDHQGKSRSLHYYENATNAKAFVLIFTGNGCSNVQQSVATIKSLRDQFTPLGVTFWMIDANPADNRSNIVTEANALGIDLPILHDRAQLVAHAYHANATPEAVCIDKVGWRIFYRGSIDDRIGSNPVSTTQYYLSNALASFLAGGTVTPRQTQTRGCDITLTSMPTPSYSTEIAPLLLDKCVRCHSPGNIAPFAMTDYSEVQYQALSMRSEILAGRMPPWHADPFHQSFTNDSSLTPTEAAKLIQWIDDGAPRGGGPDPLATANPAIDFPFAWPTSLGPPDLILTLPTQPVKATGVEAYRTLYATNMFTNDVWVRAAVILPGTVSVVHHVLAYFGTDNLVSSFFAGYVPGTYPTTFPTGTGKLLPAGQVIKFQMHYTPIGEATNDVTRLGLYTMPNAPAYPLVQSSAPNVLFTIPAGASESDYETTALSAPLSATKAVYLYEMSPHMHLRGARFKYEAIYPAGHDPASEVLLSVPYYDFHWQTLYRLVQPKYLPAGTRIRCTGAWDNSTLNQELMEAYADSSDSRYLPDRPVSWGDQSYDEMFIGYFNYAIIP
jgi:hypothetical protein